MRDRVVAVVLNYQTPNDTIKAVRSLERSHLPLHRIVVVDNGSADGSAARLEAELDRAVVIATGTNGGFSAGCNVGIERGLELGADRVFLLNSDATVEPGTLVTLSRVLDENPQLGIVGPVIVSDDDPDEIQSLGMSYQNVTGRMRHIGFRKRRSALRSCERLDVDAVSGCAMLIRREIFDAIGLFAEDYFFSFEDIDLCLRARTAGYRSACVGTAVVRHQGSLSMGQRSPQRIYFATRNHLLLASRMSGSRGWLRRTGTAAAVVGLNFAHAFLTADVPRRTGIPALVRGVRDHLAGRYGAGQ